jgi:2-amino-4-hydroxy-6-hydroxymethyldihydropteridine diphosphokinase
MLLESNKEPALSTVLVSLGANLGDAARTLVEAVAVLEARGRVEGLRVSRFYRTRPVGPVIQADFINGAFLAETACSPQGLLAELLAVEQLFGRQRRQRWGPRSLDLDLLFYDDRIIRQHDLVVPHPEIESRGFVLAPLMDLVPEWRHPQSGHRVRESYARWCALEKDPDAVVRPLATRDEAADLEIAQTARIGAI